MGVVGGAGGGAAGAGGAGLGAAGAAGATVVTGGGGAAGVLGWEVPGGGRWEVVVPCVSVFPVEAADDAAAWLAASATAERVKLLLNGDQVIGSSGSGNASEPPSRSTTTRMKSAQIEAGNVPPATAMPWTLVMNRAAPLALG